MCKGPPSSTELPLLEGLAGSGEILAGPPKTDHGDCPASTCQLRAPPLTYQLGASF